MYPSGERAWCLRRVITQKGHACRSCGSGSFIIRGARWSTKVLPALGVDLRCASCAAGATASVSVEEARRCGFDEPAT